MEYIIGILLALIVCGTAAFVGLDRDRALYPTMLIVVASYYVLFAAMGGGNEALLLEVAISAAFVVAAIAGFKLNLWLVVGGLAVHGLFDFTHHLVLRNPGVPVWWPGFCLAFDVTAAIFLGALLIKRSNVSLQRTAFGGR